MKSFIFKSPVRFTHTDPAGYVFYPRFFEMFQAAVEDWFNHGIKVDYAALILKQGIGLPTAHTECDFKKPCKLGEVIDFELTLERLGNSSMTVNYIGRVQGEERLKAQQVLVAISLVDGRPVPISDELRERLQPYVNN